MQVLSSKHDDLTNLTCINVKHVGLSPLASVQFSKKKKQKTLRGWGDGSVYIVPATEVWVLSLNPHYPYKSQTWWHMPVIPVSEAETKYPWACWLASLKSIQVQ